MTLATVTQLVDDKLRSASLGSELYPTQVRDRAIAQAVLQYGLDSPVQASELVTNVTGTSLPVPAGWVEGRSLLAALEYPVGEAPRAELDAAVAVDAAGDTIIVLASYVPALSADTVRVHYTLPHTLVSDTSTVPAEHENALACLAAAELCMQLATQKGHERDSTISAVSVNGQSQSGDLARRAKDWLRTYRNTLGLPDPDDRATANAAGAVVQFKTDRPRPRFYSLGH